MLLPTRLLEQSVFLRENPGLLPRLLRNYALSAFGRRPLRTVDLTNTYLCNLKCTHCYATGLESHERRKSAIDHGQLRQIVDKCIREGAIHFNIIGGEPTLDKGLFGLIDYIKSRRAVISLATNGNFLTREYAEGLKRLRLDVVLLSLDGLDDDPENYHGNPRKTGALAALENCLAVGQRVYVSTMLSPLNLRSGGFRKLLDFCESRRILLHVNLPVLFGEWEGNDAAFFSEEDRKQVERIFAHRYVRSCEMSSYFGSECRSGQEKLHITLYGDVMPCTFVPIHFGNILEEELPAIRERMFRHPMLDLSEKMCLPSTSAAYRDYYGKHLAGKALPVSYRDLPG